jgi:GNAT superfamily N-acetyltransferase
MTCRTADLHPAEPRGIEVRGLAPADPSGHFERFIDIRDRAFESFTDPSLISGMVDALRRDIAAGAAAACLAWRGGEAVGAGSVQIARGVCELVGIGTLPKHRRRGAATAVSAWLVRGHFAAGGELAWLTAGDEAAEAVYQRIGFRRLGSDQLNFDAA